MIRLLVLLLAFLDILLTHYLFFLDKKKDTLDMRTERGIIAKLIMNNNPSPKTFLTGCIVNITIFTLLIMYMPVETIFLIIGMISTINYYHIIMIGDDKRNWNNKRYWKIRKSVKKVKIY